MTQEHEAYVLQNQKERDKYRKRARQGVKALALIVLGGLSLGTGNLIHAVSEPRPLIARHYQDAITTLQILKGRKDILESEFVMPYNTTEVGYRLNKAYEAERQKISELDSAITSVENDVAEMKTNPELKNYLDNSEKFLNKMSWIVTSTVLGAFACIGFTGYNIAKENKYQKKK